MKPFVLALIVMWLLLFEGVGRVTAQTGDETPTRLARIYEDNDFINIWGQPTDNAYTNGTRIDLFYTKPRTSRFFLDRWMPKAGANSRDEYGWGMVQLMYTPDDLTIAANQPHDYNYSGALYGTHSLFSYNKDKKYDIQTELAAGMMGPASLAHQFQEFVHNIEHYDKPMGWGNQYGNYFLLNLNFIVEKQALAFGDNSSAPVVELLGGTQVSAGTMQNSITFYPMLRIGKMNAYFSGYMSQYSAAGSYRQGTHRSRVQFYFFLKPEMQLVLSNALLQGSLFGGSNHFVTGHLDTVTSQGGRGGGTPSPPGITDEEAALIGHPDIERVVWSLNYGAVLATGHFSLSLLQNSTSRVLKGIYDHQYGNISLYYSW